MSEHPIDRRDLLKATGAVAVLGLSSSGIKSAQATSSVITEKQSAQTGDVSIRSPSLTDPNEPGTFDQGEVIPFTLEFDGTDVATISIDTYEDNIVEAVTVRDSDGTGEATVRLNTTQLGDPSQNHGFFVNPDAGAEIVGEVEVPSGTNLTSGRYNIEVVPGTEPDTASRTGIASFNMTGQVAQEPDFNLTATEPADSTVVQGETLLIFNDIENIGDTNGTIDVLLEIGDVTDTQSVTLDSGEAETVEFNVDTEPLEPGEYEYTIQTPTDEVTNTATVAQPAELLLADLNPAETTVEQGTSLSVTATVENIGDVTETAEVVLGVGDIEEVIDVDLDGGETDTVEFTIDTEALTPDEYTHTVATADDEVTGTLIVEAATDDSDTDETDPPDDGDTDETDPADEGDTDETDPADEGDTDETDPADEGDTDETDPTDDGNDTDPADNEATDGADGDGPGFGVGVALGSLGGAGYLLKRRLKSECEE